MNQKISYFVVPITWVVAALVALILGLCHLDWVYYLIGVFTGLLNYGIMIKMNRRMLRMAELQPETASITAKRSAWLGTFLRLLIVLVILLAVFFKEVYGKDNKDGIWNIVITFGGYATIRVVLVAVYIIFGKKVEDK